MPKQDFALKKSRTPPDSVGEEKLVSVRLQPVDLAKLDSFRSRFGSKMSRPEAIRQMIDTLDKLMG